MAERPGTRRDRELRPDGHVDLELRLADLARGVAWPEPSGGLAAVVGARISAGAGAAGRRRVPAPWWRPARRGLVLALAALVALAAVAVAAGIGLPGLRIIFLPPGATPVGPSLAGSPVPTPSGSAALGLGSALGLGARTDLTGAAAIAGFEILVPERLGPPDEVYTMNRRVTLVWRSDAGLPRMASDIGLLVTQFPGTVEPGFYEKQVTSGTTVVPVRVGSSPGYWLEGAPHTLVYRDPSGAFLEETRRTVGDALIFRRGELTFRIESALGREETIALATSLTAD